MGTAQNKTLGRIFNVEVIFSDIDGDGEREVVVENAYLRAVLRFPEKLGYAFYKGRFTWGGRLQSLTYKPTRREFFLPQMLDLEDINPFGLPDELFATFPLNTATGRQRRLKMGVGVFAEDDRAEDFEALPWTWYEENKGPEKIIAFRQEIEDLGGYSYLYEKRYRFRPNAAWFALDVVWENRGESLLASAWDVHTFHAAGVPPHTAWLVAPKRAWRSCGRSRVRTFVKEASPIFATPTLEEMVSDRMLWDMDGTPWWYATGPADGDEFYLMRARFDADWGMFWAGYNAFTPQAINNVEVPPGQRATWGFDVTLGTGGRNFVAAGQNAGLTLDRKAGKAVVRLHGAAPAASQLDVHVLDPTGIVQSQSSATGHTAPNQPLQLEVDLPMTGDYAELALHARCADAALHTQEIVPLQPARPTAHLPFAGNGAPIFVAVHHDLEKPEADGRYLWCHGTQAGFAVDWTTPELRAPDDLSAVEAICLVGDAWPTERLAELRAWLENGGGLLLCAPFGALAAHLEALLPLHPLAEKVVPADHKIIEGAGMQRYAESQWQVELNAPNSRHLWRQLHTQTMERVDPVVGLQLGTPHCTSERLMLEPDAKVHIGYWQPCQAHPEAIVPLRFTDEQRHPAVGLRPIGQGRMAAVASRPAWGAHYRKAVWDGWGQYHRAFWAGLMGWLVRRW